MIRANIGRFCASEIDCTERNHECHEERRDPCDSCGRPAVVGAMKRTRSGSEKDKRLYEDSMTIITLYWIALIQKRDARQL
jgi:hypothetical protein